MEKEALDAVASPDFRDIMEVVIGQYGWLLLAALLGFFFKKLHLMHMDQVLLMMQLTHLLIKLVV